MSEIKIRITADNAEAIKKLKDVATAAGSMPSEGGVNFDKSTKSADGLLHKLMEVTVVTAGIVEGVRLLGEGLEKLLKPGFEFSVQMEKSQVGIAGIIKSMMTANGQALTFAQSMQIAGQVIDQIKQNGAKIGLDPQAMTEGFQAMIGAGLSAKMNLQQIVELTTIGMKAVKAFGLENRQIAQEMRDLFTGQITMDTQIAKGLNINSGDIARAKQTADGLYGFLKQRMAGMQEMAYYYPKTMAGGWEKLKVVIKSGSAEALEGFEKQAKETVDNVVKEISTIDASGQIKLNPEVKAAFAEIANFVAVIGKGLLNGAREVLPEFAAMLRVVGGVLQFCAEYSATIFRYVLALAAVKGLGLVFTPLIAALKTVWALLIATRTEWTRNAVAANAATGAATVGALANVTRGVKALGTALRTLTMANLPLFLVTMGLTVFGDKIMDWVEQVKVKLGLGSNAADFERKMQEEEAAREKEKANQQLPENLQAKPEITKDPYEMVQAKYEATIKEIDARAASSKANIDNEIKRLQAEQAITGKNMQSEITKLQAQSAQVDYSAIQAKIGTYQAWASEAGAYKSPSEIQGSILNNVTGLKSELEKAGLQVDNFSETIKNLGAITQNASGQVAAEGTTWQRETGSVNIEDLKDNTKQAISALAEYFNKETGRKLIISSGFRTWGGGGPGEGHKGGVKFDVVDDAASTLLENNVGGIRDKLKAYGEKLGLRILDAYAGEEGPNAPGHLDFNASGYSGKSVSENLLTGIDAKSMTPEFQAIFEQMKAAQEQNYKSYADRLEIEGRLGEAEVIRNNLEKTELIRKLQANGQTKAAQDEAEILRRKNIKAMYEQNASDIEKMKTTADVNIADIMRSKLPLAEKSAAVGGVVADFNAGIASRIAELKKANETIKDPKITKQIQDLEFQARDYGIEQYNKIISDQQAVKDARIAAEDAKYSLGKTNQEQHDQNVLNIEKEYAAAIWQTVQALKAKAVAAGDVATAAAADKMIVGLKKTQEETDILSQRFRSSAEDALTEFFSTGIQQANSLGEAFRNMIHSIVTDMNKIFSRQLARQIMGSFYKSSPDIQENADGGHITGPGTGTSDSILSWLSNGEFVVKAASVRKYGTGFLHALNSGALPTGKLPRFNTGGLAGSVKNGATGAVQSLAEMKNGDTTLKIVNIDDPGAIPRYLQSRAGERVILNTLKKHSGTVGRTLKF